MADCPIPSPVTYLPSARRPLTEAHQWHPGVSRGSFGRSLARRPCPQVPQGHPRVAKHHLTDLRMVPFRCTTRSSARLPRPQVLQRHPVVAKGASGRSLARLPRPQMLQRHPVVAKRVLFPSFGTATLPTSAPEASRRGKWGFWTVFDMGPLSTGTSGPSSRGEASPNRSQNGPFPMHQSVFGTESRPTGAPGASRRGEGVLLAGLRHGDLAHRCSRGITAWRRGASGRSLARLPLPQALQRHPRVAKGVLFPPFSTATLPTST